ncbi:hypothetical protein EVAR_101275_1 [Eumeta japonica]|uniref:Uncharacterized protein n=1 Tax=Eumeta variegata TaxID=151549 RepID=A0A4C1SCG2_EUMVA|nr:hypothetical protein EVAR_101275_1 [Eumeta japonica]
MSSNPLDEGAIALGERRTLILLTAGKAYSKLRRVLARMPISPAPSQNSTHGLGAPAGQGSLQLETLLGGSVLADYPRNAGTAARPLSGRH